MAVDTVVGAAGKSGWRGRTVPTVVFQLLSLHWFRVGAVSADVAGDDSLSSWACPEVVLVFVNNVRRLEDCLSRSVGRR